MARFAPLLLLPLLLVAAPARADEAVKPYLHELSELPLGLRFPVNDEVRSVAPAAATIKERAEATDPTVDRLTLNLPLSGRERAAYLKRLAAPGRYPALRRYAAGKATLVLDDAGLALIDPAALQKRFSQKHHHLSVPTKALRQNPALKAALLAELTPYLAADERAAVGRAIAGDAALDADTLLLPKIARTSVGKFTKYRGPNCFRTALSFQDPRLPSLPAINSKVERGFHRDMINNDELWYALSEEFVEVDTTKEAMRYGDVLVFFDVPYETATVDFRWLKHASTYLFGDYTYSKESYAANSPHTVKRLSDEWRSWEGRLPHFAVKVYRKFRAP